MMTNFPEFMKNPANRIAATNQATAGVEGYVFDGAEGSQMAFWTCHETAPSASHVHDFDEYMIVVQGCYILILDGKRVSWRLARNTSFRAVSCIAAKWSLVRERFTHSVATALTDTQNLLRN